MLREVQMFFQEVDVLQSCPPQLDLRICPTSVYASQLLPPNFCHLTSYRWRAPRQFCSHLKTQMIKLIDIQLVAGKGR